MRLTAKQDVEAPADFVFQNLTDFENWERAAMRRGADVQRSSSPAKPGRGTSWQTEFAYRGKARKVTLTVERLEAPALLVIKAVSAPADVMTRIEVSELAGKRTRIEAVLEINAKTLAARLFVQSLRLARLRVERRLNQSIGQLAADIEDRYRRSLRTR